MLSFSPKFGCSTTKEAISYSLERKSLLRWLKYRSAITWCACIGSSWWVSFAIDVGYSICVDIPDVLRTFSGTVWMLSFLATLIMTRLIVELPFAVRVEDGTPVSTEILQMAHNSGCTSIAERRIGKFQWAGTLMINLPLSKGPWFIPKF